MGKSELCRGTCQSIRLSHKTGRVSCDNNIRCVYRTVDGDMQETLLCTQLKYNAQISVSPPADSKTLNTLTTFDNPVNSMFHSTEGAVDFLDVTSNAIIAMGRRSTPSSVPFAIVFQCFNTQTAFSPICVIASHSLGGKGESLVRAANKSDGLTPRCTTSFL